MIVLDVFMCFINIQNILDTFKPLIHLFNIDAFWYVVMDVLDNYPSELNIFIDRGFTNETCLK